MIESEPFTEQVTQTAGPNGDIDWMNCGIEAGGWNPPYVDISDLVTVDLDNAISQGGPFTPCSEYVWAFKQYGEQFGRRFYLFYVCATKYEIDGEIFVFSSPHPLGFDRSSGEQLQTGLCWWQWRTGSDANHSRQV